MKDIHRENGLVPPPPPEPAMAPLPPPPVPLPAPSVQHVIEKRGLDFHWGEPDPGVCQG